MSKPGLNLRRDLRLSLTAAAALAFLSTFGDWLWANYIRDGAILPGVIHGAVIFVALAGALSWAAGTRRAAKLLFPALPVVGILLAALFYPLARMTDYLTSLLITWAGMWLATAALDRLARGRVEGAGLAVARGFAAAIGSGLAFWAVSGMWTSPAPEGPSYPWHFACWTFAFFPGFLALFIGQGRE